jgi:hypothetical protein
MKVVKDHNIEKMPKKHFLLLAESDITPVYKPQTENGSKNMIPLSIP